MEHSFYVYYRIADENAAAARRAVMALFEELRISTGISGRLARNRDDPVMWMEIYERVAEVGHFEKALRSGETRLDLDKLVTAGSARKTEVFINDVLNPDSQIGHTACV